MARKSFQEKLQHSGDLPKVEETPKGLMLLAPPLAYDEVVREIPHGKVATAPDLGDSLARKADADYSCPMMTGFFLILVANAAHERQDPDVPWWRALKRDGELNPKYPGGIDAQEAMLADEGHRIVHRGDRAFVDRLEDVCATL
ncbi:MAG: MGMT family protein [Micrococcales bacterium]|nr:MGMT family protein [Micrococcales bacterium]